MRQIDARDDAHLRIVQKTMGDVGRRRAENVGEDQHALIRGEVRDEPAGFRLALLGVHVAGHVEDCDGVAEGVARGAEDVPGTAFNALASGSWAMMQIPADTEGSVRYDKIQWVCYAK